MFAIALAIGTPRVRPSVPRWWQGADRLLDGVAPSVALCAPIAAFELAGADAAFPGLLSLSSGAKWVVGSDGTLTQVAADQPAWDWSSGRRRLLVEAAATNKVTCRKHNPVDLGNVTRTGDAAGVLTVVDDTAALTAAGLIGLCSNGRVYRLDNSAGTTTANADLSGPAGNTNGHVVAAYIRSGAAVTSGAVRGNGASADGNAQTSSTSYQLKSAPLSVTTASRTMRIEAYAGKVVHFILPQFVEASVLGSIIPGDTLAAVTRIADDLRLAPAATAQAAATGGASLVLRGAVHGGGTVLGGEVDGRAIVRDAGSGFRLIRSDGGATTAVVQPGCTDGAAFGVAVRWSATAAALSAAGEAPVGATDSPLWSLADETGLRLGADFAGTNALPRLFVDELAIWPLVGSDAALVGQAHPWGT